MVKSSGDEEPDINNQSTGTDTERPELPRKTPVKRKHTPTKPKNDYDKVFKWYVGEVERVRKKAKRSGNKELRRLLA